MDEKTVREMLGIIKHDHVPSRIDVDELEKAIGKVSVAIALYRRVDQNGSEGAHMQESVAGVFISMTARELMENKAFKKMAPISGEPGFI